MHKGEHDTGKLFLRLPLLFALTGSKLSRHQHERAIRTPAQKCLFDRRQFRQGAIGIAHPIDVVPKDRRDVSMALVDEGAIRRQRNRSDPQIGGDCPLMKRSSFHSHEFFALALRFGVGDVQVYAPAVRRSIGPHK